MSFIRPPTYTFLEHPICFSPENKDSTSTANTNILFSQFFNLKSQPQPLNDEERIQQVIFKLSQLKDSEYECEIDDDYSDSDSDDEYQKVVDPRLLSKLLHSFNHLKVSESESSDEFSDDSELTSYENVSSSDESSDETVVVSSFIPQGFRIKNKI